MNTGTGSDSPTKLACTLVLTTTSDPALLDAYRDNFEKFGRLESVTVIVVPDRKTPPDAFKRCRDLSRRGLNVACPPIEEQEAFLTKIGLPPAMIPYDSDNRRNVGFLMAYAAGASFLVSIDDDNYCLPGEDFFGEHAVVCGADASRKVTESPTGFLNLCALLELERDGPVYPRGFPYRFRHRDESPETAERETSVHINAGLWTLHPDIDAITWLVASPRVTSFKGKSVVLGRGTWTPVNSQNTALRAECIPAYYFVRMGHVVMGLPLDRYGDIFSGYFVQACAKHLGGCVRAGTPVAEHRRNKHDKFKDATNEWAGILVLEDLLPWLMEARLSGATYIEAYRSLSFLMEDAVETFKGLVWTDATRAYFHQVADHMRLWLKACEGL